MANYSKKVDGLFNGGASIFVTKNSIAIRRINKTYSKSGCISTDKTLYVPKTSRNMAKAKRIVGNLRWGRSSSK